jgi:hypothetical protein
MIIRFIFREGEPASMEEVNLSAVAARKGELSYV